MIAAFGPSWSWVPRLGMLPILHTPFLKPSKLLVYGFYILGRYEQRDHEILLSDNHGHPIPAPPPSTGTHRQLRRLVRDILGLIESGSPIIKRLKSGIHIPVKFG